jgi:AcrR family transcriptional regulator
VSTGGPSRPTARDALRLGLRHFQAGERIDMQSLAAELGIDRATLYRWVGTRDRLLVEILWYLMSATVDRLRKPAAGVQPPSAEIVSGAAEASITNTGMQRFLEREGELALRLLTTRSTDFQQRLIDLIAEVVDADRQCGRLDSSIPGDDLPYVLVRIMESYVYISLITGDRPDTARASRVIHALLPAADG